LLVRFAVVLATLLLLLFADRWLTGLLGRAQHIDRRQFATLRSVIGVGLQVVAVLLILFMLIGLPGQFGTMLGLAGAGLTVALKDFIIAFIGWFVLMGKNGIRVGDWVEINGVSGEVKELSVFHTVLLETGNWTGAGHPTGRRVTFTNSYAIEGHYFNFSTTGQWLWDELTVVVPAGRDPQPVVDAIQKETAETVLRKLIEKNEPRYAPAAYILAVMLERKRILKVKEQIVRDGQRVFIYEQPKTGDIFTIADPNLRLDQLEDVQRDVAMLLERGLNPVASVAENETAPQATEPTMPVN